MTNPLEPYNAHPAPRQHSTPLPMPGWPTTAPLTGPVETYGERQTVVYVPGPYGQMVPVLKDHLPAPHPAPAPRDLSPQPLIDPMAQRMAAGGILAAGVGAGAWFLFSALAGAALSIAALAALILACKLPTAGRSRAGDTYITNNQNSWWGHSSTHN